MDSPRPFLLLVDSGSYDEPPNRYFGTIEAAEGAAAEYADRFQPFVWITEIRLEGNVVHVKDGKKVT